MINFARASAQTDVDELLEEAIMASMEPATDSPWACVVWDDPVNLMNYVVYIFHTVLGLPKPEADRLMLQVHN